MEKKILGYVVLTGTLTNHEDDCFLKYIKWEFYRFLKDKEKAMEEAEWVENDFECLFNYVKIYEVTQDGYGKVIYEND